MSQAPHNTDSYQQLADDQYHKALDFVAAGEPCAAVEGFLECLAVDPNKLDAMHGLVRALQDCGRLEEGIEWAKKLIARDPEDPLSHTGLSILYQHKGMIAEAEAEATKARLLDWKIQLKSGVRPATQL